VGYSSLGGGGLIAFTTWLDAQLDLWVAKQDGLALLNAVLNYVALPAHIIIPASKLNVAAGTFVVEKPDHTSFTLTIGPPPRPRGRTAV
jgi:hypothetical protein